MHFEWIKKPTLKSGSFFTFDQQRIYRFFLRHWSIRTRFTVLYLTIFGSTLILFCSLLYRNFTADQQNEFDISLYNHAVDIAQGITVGPYGNFIINPDVLSTGGKIFPFSAGHVFIQILSNEGTEIARSRNLGNAHLPLYRRNWPLLSHSRGIFQTITAKELSLDVRPGRASTFRLLTALSPGQPARNFILQVAVPEFIVAQVTRDLRQFLWFGIPLTLILATFGGLFLSQRALAPINNMIEKANSLSPNHLSERIPVPLADGELKDLALTLNALLDRLQSAFESQERFIADASHELKTPLAILRGELDVFKSRDRSPREISTFINSAMQELNHLSRVVEDLLILARVDVGSVNVTKSLTRFEEIVLDVISKLEVLGRKKDVKIRFNLTENEACQNENGEQFSLQGDSDLLKILVKNLVENAIKYSYPSQIIEVKLQSDQERIYLEVTDYGPGIPEEILPRIFERFYRGSTQIPGAGLGLAIAQRIAEIHGGKVEAKSSIGSSTTFNLQIKRF